MIPAEDGYLRAQNFLYLLVHFVRTGVTCAMGPGAWKGRGTWAEITPPSRTLLPRLAPCVVHTADLRDPTPRLCGVADSLQTGAGYPRAHTAHWSPWGQ